MYSNIRTEARKAPLTRHLPRRLLSGVLPEKARTLTQHQFFLKTWCASSHAKSASLRNDMLTVVKIGLAHQTRLRKPGNWFWNVCTVNMSTLNQLCAV